MSDQSLSELKDKVVADGVIDAEEAKQIRDRVYADGRIDREEADFLFAVNDVVSGNDNDPAWCELFVEAISDHLLKDENSPGAIDAEEAAWLVERIQGDGEVDQNEKALLKSLAGQATSVPDALKQLIESA